MAKSFTNIMGVQFGPIKEFEGREGIGCSMKVYLNGLEVGLYRDEANGGEDEFDVILPQEEKYFPNKKSIADDDIHEWRKNTLSILSKIAKKYLKDITPTDEYCDIFLDKAYLRDDSYEEQFIKELCSAYRNSLGMIEKSLKKFIKENNTDCVVCIIKPHYMNIGDTKFVDSFDIRFSTKLYKFPKEEIQKSYIEKYNVDYIVLKIDDFIIEAGDLNA